MQPTLDRLSHYHDMTTDKAETDRRHIELLNDGDISRRTLVTAIETLMQFMQGHVNQTEVINQPESVRTPDVDKVVAALESVHGTLKTHQNTDLSEVTKVLQAVLTQVSALPKEQPSIDIPAEIIVKNQVDTSKDIQAVERAVKCLKLEAKPVVVPAPNVKVDAPDLSPLKHGLADVEKAVKAIKLDVPKLEHLDTTQTNTLITERFDEYRLRYDMFDSNDPDAKVIGIQYLYQGKAVCSLSYNYDDTGRLVGVKKTEAKQS
jgi:hypothetical protein